MKYVRRVRHILALVLFVCTGVTLGGIDLYLNVALGRIRKETVPMRRKRTARWQARWSRWWYVICRYVGGVRLTFMLDDSLKTVQGPFIVISNHYGAFDGLVIDRVLHLFGHHDYRPVAKSSVGGIPIMGRAWREMGIAFVKRDHNPGDIDAVAQLAEAVREDGANAVIFVEGTVLTKDTALYGKRTILPPKTGGFRRLVRAMPGYPILSVTMYWRDFDPHWLSDEGYVPPGNDLLIECRVLPPPPVGVDDSVLKAVLTDEWQRKAEWLLTAE